jgi:stress response protein SCP2
METQGWSAASNNKFVLEKDIAVFLPKDLRIMKLGLGWDTKMDLDASVIMMTKDGKTACESVWYNNK